MLQGQTPEPPQTFKPTANIRTRTSPQSTMLVRSPALNARHYVNGDCLDVSGDSPDLGGHFFDVNGDSSKVGGGFFNVNGDCLEVDCD